MKRYSPWQHNKKRKINQYRETTTSEMTDRENHHIIHCLSCFHINTVKGLHSHLDQFYMLRNHTRFIHIKYTFK